MNISLEILDENNSFIYKTYLVTNETLYDMKNKLEKELSLPFNYQCWYLEGNIVSDNMYNEWQNKEYLVIIENNNIELTIQHNNETIDIIVDDNITIKDLKNILSIDDNIYYRNKLLNDNISVKKYNNAHLNVIPKEATFNIY